MRRGGLILGFMMAAQCLLTFLYNLTALNTGKSGTTDIGYFANYLHNFYLTGTPTTNLLEYMNGEINTLGFHFSPILLILAPLTTLPLWTFYLLQSVVVASTAVPVFLACQHYLKNRNNCLILTFAYMFNIFVLNAAVFSFHEQCIGLLFICWGIYALVKKRFALLLFMMLLLALTKEHYGLTICGFGLSWYFIHQERKGIALAVIGAAFFVVVIKIIMPWFIGGDAPMLSSNATIGRYNWIFAEKEIFQRGIDMIFKLGVTPVEYLIIIFGMFLFLPLAAPVFLLPTGADFLVALLSSNPLPRSPASYHSITVIPFLIIACAKIFDDALFQRIKAPVIRNIKSTRSIRALIILIAVFNFGFALNLSALPIFNNTWKINEYDLSQPEQVNEIRKLLPKAARLGVQGDIGYWFYDWRYITIIESVKDYDYMIINLEYPYEFSSQHPFGNPYDPETYLPVLQQITAKNKILYYSSGWAVLTSQPEIIEDPAKREQVDRDMAKLKNFFN